ncbi:MAG: phosphate:Na+ symporter [Fusobacteriaceae bacterium]|jgi:phosphate:Na+ symporter|nr:Na/Pi-cotransporter II-related protein [Fusobacteriales bacterium]MDN5303310.1 phosphate:Na+ symporter [Fusobacteriaceae bacterium]
MLKLCAIKYSIRRKFKGMNDIILTVIGGLGIFLFGMHYLSNGMQNLAGNRLKKIISSLTDNRVLGVAIGVLVTALVQSSSITTVMVVGFVNAGLMTLKQSLGVILGANIGTTITGWILVLKVGKYGLPIAGIGALMFVFGKKEKTKNRGMVLLGLGLIFLGLEFMKDGFKPLRKMPEFIEMFHKFQAESVYDLKAIILAACVGALMTSIVQSSSATLGITIGLASQGLITPLTGVALVLGENIGTTITAFLASLGTTVNARRAALAHTIVNVIGVTWVITIFPWFYNIVQNVSNHTSDPATLLATAHTSFNVTNALLFTPFITYFAKLLEKLIPSKEDENKEIKYTHLDVRMLETPTIAISNINDEVKNMGNDVLTMFKLVETIFEKNLDKTSNEVKEIFKLEDKLDMVQKEISGISSMLLGENFSNEISIEAKNILTIVDEYESISDYLMSEVKLYLKLLDNNITLDKSEKDDLLKLHSELNNYFNFVNDITSSERTEENYLKSFKVKTKITTLFKEIRNSHLDEFRNTKKDLFYTIGYMDMLNTYRRIKNHIFQVTEVLVKEN